jgi:hypothetical protein
MTKFEKLQIQARDAIDFLSNHPAIPPIFDLFQALRFSINPVCKRRYLEDTGYGIKVGITSKYAKRFKEEFAEELNQYTEEELKTQRSLVSIQVSYKELFGEEWKFDHIEYWGEMCFFVFNGEDISGIKQENWETYEAIRRIKPTRTFEEMIVNIAKEFKKIYGNFCEYDFLTKKEKLNHKKQLPLITVERINSANHKISNLVSNPKYIKVTDAEINLRWYKWFKTTEYYKKNF